MLFHISVLLLLVCAVIVLSGSHKAFTGVFVVVLATRGKNQSPDYEQHLSLQQSKECSISTSSHRPLLISVQSHLL